MHLLIHALRHITLSACALCLCSGLFAQPKDATEEETAWFAGEWTVIPAPVEGFESIVAESRGTVRIEHRGGARLSRRSPAGKGREAESVEFAVKKLGTNFPWWSDGGSAVAKKVAEDVFDLAGVGPLGKADWSRALRHTRVMAAKEKAAAALPPGFVQILVTHVKPDRQTDFELWLHEYRLLVERLIAEEKLNDAEKRAYAAWRILAPDNETLALNQDAGLPLEYLFILDPVVEGASYDLADYLRRGLGAEAAEQKMQQWRDLLAKPQAVLSGVPL